MRKQTEPNPYAQFQKRIIWKSFVRLMGAAAAIVQHEKSKTSIFCTKKYILLRGAAWYNTKKIPIRDEANGILQNRHCADRRYCQLSAKHQLRSPADTICG